MKFLKAIAVAVALLPTIGTAQAATVDLAWDAAKTVGEIVNIKKNPVGSAGKVTAGAFHTIGSNSTSPSLLGKVIAYCVDLASNIKLPSTYTVKNDLFDANTTSRIQKLFDANYVSVDTSDKLGSAALQVAIWDTIYGTNYKRTASSSVAALAETYKLNAAGYTGARLYDLTFLDGGSNRQNLVTAEPSAVPIPAAGVMLFSVLGGVGIIARRRQNRKAA